VLAIADVELRPASLSDSFPLMGDPAEAYERRVEGLVASACGDFPGRPYRLGRTGWDGVTRTARSGDLPGIQTSAPDFGWG
jgi:hypothetical protein